VEDIPESRGRLVQGNDKSGALETLVGEIQKSNNAKETRK